MILIIHRDASYLSEPKAHIREGCHFFVDYQNFQNYRETNGDVHTVLKIMKTVMGSAAEAQVGALFNNGQEAEPIRITLHKMGHTQPATPMQTDNSTANSIKNNTVHKKNQQPWICTFILFNIESNKTIPMYYGNQAWKTCEIILPNITRRTTTNKYGQYNSIHRIPQRELL